MRRRKPFPPEGESYPDDHCPLEFFRAGEIDLDAWIDFLDRHVPPEQQDDADTVRCVWGEFLAARDPREYRDRGCGEPAPPEALPGTEEKIEEMARRAQRKQRTDHPGDPRHPD